MRRLIAGCFLVAVCLLGAQRNFSAVMFAAGVPETLYVNGEVLNDQNQPIAGAVCTVTGAMLSSSGLTVTTGSQGTFQFAFQSPGVYSLTCAAVGYKPVSKSDLQVESGPPVSIQVVLPTEQVLRQTVEVTAKAPTVTQQSAAPPEKLTSQELQALPLVEQKFKAALPLIPGVIRTPDGKINIKGTSEGQGLLLVDGAETVDPVTGAYSIEIPIDAVQSLEVYKSAYASQYGRFSGGLTTVETKPPSDQFHFELNDFVPTPRIKSGHIVGIADDEPRLYLTGPVIPGKLDFMESAEYDVVRQPVRGLAWPHNETDTYGLNSFTSLQYYFSSNHFLTVNTDVFPKRREFADINSLVPQSASSNYGQRGFSTQFLDHYMTGSGGILTSLFQFTKFDSNSYGQGPLDMLDTPNGWQGNFFNSFTRSTDQEEISEQYELPRKKWLGAHHFVFGADYVRRSYRGTSVSRPIMLTYPSGATSESINFLGPGRLAANDIEAAAFAQDHWVFNDNIAADAGLRFSTQTLGEPAAFAPRIGVVYTPGHSGKTIFRGGVGIFYDRLPLLAGDFTENPTRVITLFNPDGTIKVPPAIYQNAYIERLENGQLVVPSKQRLASTPYNLTWNLESERELKPNLIFRLNYLYSHTVNEFTVSPVILHGPAPTMLLSNTGTSLYHEFEAELHYQRSNKVEVNFAYVNSLARGDLNTLGAIYVPFEQPVIRPDAYGVLPSDVPNRFLTWGTFHFPMEFGAAPVLDIHSGFPWSATDVFGNYVGIPNGRRFPAFASLDLQLTKDFRISFIKKLSHHKYRLGFLIYNLTNHLNPRDVYYNTASPYFSHFVGFQHIFFDAYIDILD
jgi:Carboxypeptidase regulatory-like domain/TonB-dependent Receptor Plug Domain/TonB dependent receptor-like, beta-barrel